MNVYFGDCIPILLGGARGGEIDHFRSHQALIFPVFSVIKF